MKAILKNIVLFISSSLFSSAGATQVLVGQTIPDFEMIGTDGDRYSKDTLEGDFFVIAFFPKAFTGG
ncbi:MAG: hypothetical protein ACJ0Q2_09415 [Candidatus Azotimanducaceae bacterium]